MSALAHPPARRHRAKQRKCRLKPGRRVEDVVEEGAEAQRRSAQGLLKMLMSSRSVKVVTRLLAPKRVGHVGRAGRRGDEVAVEGSRTVYSHVKTLRRRSAVAYMAVRAAEDHEVVEEGGRSVIVLTRLLGADAHWPPKALKPTWVATSQL